MARQSKPKAAPKPRGRPSKFTDEIAAEIVERLSTGEPLTVICRDKSMPCDDTVRNWSAANDAFARDIARAREAGFDQIALDALAIADETSRDTKAGPNDTEVCNTEWISRSRLRVETRLKLLAKWDPKRYGDKLDVNANVGGLTIEIVKFGDAA